jgi:hypothetical protein
MKRFSHVAALSLLICGILAMGAIGCAGQTGAPTTQQAQLNATAWQGYVDSMSVQVVARTAGAISDKTYGTLETARIATLALLPMLAGPPTDIEQKQVDAINAAWKTLAPGTAPPK